MYRPSRIGPYPVLPLRSNPPESQVVYHSVSNQTPGGINPPNLPCGPLDSAAARDRICRSTFLGGWPRLSGYQHIAFGYLLLNPPDVTLNYLYSYEITFAWHGPSGGDIFAFPFVGLFQPSGSRCQVYKDLNAESIAHDGQSVEFTARGCFVLHGSSVVYSDRLVVGVHIMNLSGTQVAQDNGDAFLSVFCERWSADIPLDSPVM